MTRVVTEKIYNHFRKGENGAYIIDVTVKHIDHLFSKFDPTPLHNKDLDEKIIEHILRQIVIFPANVNVELHIHIPKRFKKHQADMEKAIRHHFEYELLDSQLHLQRRMQKGMRTLNFAGLLFVTLFVSSYALMHSSQHVVWHLIGEGMAIGAWVALWHPLEMLLYDWLPLYESKKKYGRLQEMIIQFNYL